MRRATGLRHLPAPSAPYMVRIGLEIRRLGPKSPAFPRFPTVFDRFLDAFRSGHGLHGPGGVRHGDPYVVEAAGDVPVAPGAHKEREERPRGAGDERQRLGDEVQRGVDEHLLVPGGDEAQGAEQVGHGVEGPDDVLHLSDVKNRSSCRALR